MTRPAPPLTAKLQETLYASARPSPFQHATIERNWEDCAIIRLEGGANRRVIPLRMAAETPDGPSWILCRFGKRAATASLGAGKGAKRPENPQLEAKSQFSVRPVRQPPRQAAADFGRRLNANTYTLFTHVRVSQIGLRPPVLQCRIAARAGALLQCAIPLRSITGMPIWRRRRGCKAAPVVHNSSAPRLPKPRASHEPPRSKAARTPVARGAPRQAGGGRGPGRPRAEGGQEVVMTAPLDALPLVRRDHRARLQAPAPRWSPPCSPTKSRR